MEGIDLVIKLITELRHDMNLRFERVDQRLDLMEERFDKRLADFETKFATKLQLAEMHLSLSRDIAKVNDRLTEETIWGRRELSKRVDKCELEIDELKRRAP